MNKISVFGASGHAKVILEIIELNNIIIENVFDADDSKTTLLNYSVNHDLKMVKSNTFVAIGNNSIRKKIVEQYGLTPDSLFHPSAVISKYVGIGIGSVVMAGVSINADSKIGNHCILNTNCSIDHDCMLEDYVHVSPNASLAGNVQIGEGTHVGIGATIIQGIKIGKNCVIGAGAVIIKDIPDNSLVVGNPGKVIKRNIIS